MTVFALSAALAQQPAAPQPVLIWVEDDLPEEKVQRRAAKLTGSQSPWTYTALDLAFPPDPADAKDADDKAYQELTHAVERGTDRWDEFDVELAIAQELSNSLSGIEVVRDDADREAVMSAQLMLGAAVDMAFSTDEFTTSDVAEPFRVELPGLVANKALLQVLALDNEKMFTVSEVNSDVAYRNLDTLREEYPKLASGTLEVGVLPDGARLVINGRPSEGGDPILPAGHYWVHLDSDGIIRGRTQVTISPGQTVTLPRLVDETERAQTDRKVAADSLETLPGDVTSAIDAIASTHPASPVFLATLNDEGKLVVLPYSEGAEVVRNAPVTVAMGAEVGGGAVATQSFYYWDPDNNPAGRIITAPGVSGAFDLEVGIYNLALLGSAEVHITPTQHLLFGSDGQTDPGDNQSSPVYFKGHGGLGLYALRPTKYKRPTLLLAGTYGYFSPGHLGPGARLTLGLPTSPKNWFKITFHGYYGNQVLKSPDGSVGAYPDHPLFAGGLRIGFQTAF